MSVVDQRALLAAGRNRRLLVRVLLVLGGALAATVIGWLLSAGSASADELPSPTAPSLPTTGLAPTASALTGSIGQPDLAKAVLSSTPLPNTPLPTAPLPSAPLSGAPLPSAPLPTAPLPGAPLPSAPLPSPQLPGAPADLGQVAQQFHLTMDGLDGRVAPTVVPVVPASALAPLAGTVPSPTTTAPVTPSTVVGMPPVTYGPVQPGSVAAQEQAQAQAQARRHPGQLGRADVRPTGSPLLSGVNHRMPVVPPVQPLGSTESSTDSSTHGGAGFAPAGAAYLPTAQVFGVSGCWLGVRYTPCPATVTGQQPGTSPD